MAPDAAVNGVRYHFLSVYSLFSELGADLAKFPSSKHFASWLGLCPDNRISGGRVLSVKTRHVKHRVAHALRLAAHGLSHSRSVLGAYFRRMRAKLGPPKAITATPRYGRRDLAHLPKGTGPGRGLDECVARMHFLADGPAGGRCACGCG